jgi:hypothetical protein
METISIQRLLLLRKVTRALSEHFRGLLKDHVTALTPLIRPKPLLGDFISGLTKESPNFADKAFQEFLGIYQGIAGNKPFPIHKELKPPIEATVSPLELHPLEYVHTANSASDSKVVTVTSPLRWVLTYPGYSLTALRALLAQKNPSTDALQKFAVHYALLNFVIGRQPAFARTLDALRFSLTSGTVPEFGELPVTFISAPVATLLPPDDVIIENTEISGSDAFEEVVDLESVISLRDPLKDQIVAIAQGFGAGVVPGSAMQA